MGGMFYAIALFRTWAVSNHTGSAASDHLLVGTFFFLFTIILGILVGANSLSNPPFMPYGKLHLVAYTHMTFVGFIVNTIMGVLSYYIPIALATDRVRSDKHRGPYYDRLTTIMNRWHGIQIVGLSLGTMGLALLASLTWNVPLSSPYIQLAMWSFFTLLLGSLVIFCTKLAYVLAKKPTE